MRIHEKPLEHSPFRQIECDFHLEVNNGLRGTMVRLRKQQDALLSTTLEWYVFSFETNFAFFFRLRIQDYSMNHINAMPFLVSLLSVTARRWYLPYLLISKQDQEDRSVNFAFLNRAV